MVQKQQKQKFRNVFLFLRTFKDIFEKNNVDSINNYSKDKLDSIISFAFGVYDSRSIKSKFDFGLRTNIIMANSMTGFRINPDIIETYNNFVEKNKDYILELDLLDDSYE